MAGMMMGGDPAAAPQGQPQPGQPQPGQLDTAQTAGQPQEGDPDTVTFETMVAGLREHVFGKGEAAIVERMKSADDPGRVCGEIVFALVREAAKQAEQAGRELDMDILMGVATELIDDLTELMAAHGIELDDKAREYALMVANQLYVESAQPSDDERNMAKQSLSEMRQSGDVDEAVKYVQQRGAEAGSDPFGVSQMPERPGMMAKGE